MAGDGLTVHDLVNRFLTSKRQLVASGEIVERTWLDYHDAAQRIVRQFGLTRLVTDLDAGDFERLREALAKVRGPVALGGEVQRIRRSLDTPSPPA